MTADIAGMKRVTKDKSKTWNCSTGIDRAQELENMAYLFPYLSNDELFRRVLERYVMGYSASTFREAHFSVDGD